MAATRTEDASTASAPDINDMPLARRAVFWAFASLLVFAAGLYVWWGVSFGVWIDNGLYAVVITLALFGLAGMWLMLPNPPVGELPPPA